jgi:hypothetical protein
LITDSDENTNYALYMRVVPFVYNIEASGFGEPDKPYPIGDIVDDLVTTAQSVTTRSLSESTPVKGDTMLVGGLLDMLPGPSDVPRGMTFWNDAGSVRGTPVPGGSL